MKYKVTYNINGETSIDIEAGNRHEALEKANKIFMNIEIPRMNNIKGRLASVKDESEIKQNNGKEYVK